MRQATRPVDRDRPTGNCPLLSATLGSLSFVSEKIRFGSPFLPSPHPSFALSSSSSFLVCVCVQQIGGGCRGGFCANNVRPFGGFPNFSLLLTMKNVSRYSKNWLRPLPRKQRSITIHKNRVHIMNDCYKVFLLLSLLSSPSLLILNMIDCTNYAHL